MPVRALAHASLVHLLLHYNPRTFQNPSSCTQSNTWNVPVVGKHCQSNSPPCFSVLHVHPQPSSIRTSSSLAAHQRPSIVWPQQPLLKVAPAPIPLHSPAATLSVRTGSGSLAGCSSMTSWSDRCGSQDAVRPCILHPYQMPYTDMHSLDAQR